MARAIINNVLSELDIQNLIELHRRTNPQANVPEFGSPNTETMVLRDEERPDRIVGFIHLEHALEVREIITDPAYELRQQALSHAFTAMESRIRCGDLGSRDRYYVSVPIHHHHVQQFYRDEGAVRIDANATRYVKKLR